VGSGGTIYEEHPTLERQVRIWIAKGIAIVHVCMNTNSIYADTADKERTASSVESMIKLLYTFPICAGTGVILLSSH